MVHCTVDSIDLRSQLDLLLVVGWGVEEGLCLLKKVMLYCFKVRILSQCYKDLCILHTVVLQVGAIAPQNLEHLLQTIHDCLASTDWTTRKAAAETLCVLSLNAGNVTAEGAASTLTALEACRFDKV